MRLDFVAALSLSSFHPHSNSSVERRQSFSACLYVCIGAHSQLPIMPREGADHVVLKQQR